jgi:membrane protease YdiL (CAAX protease family)
LDATGWVVALAQGVFSNLVVATLTFSLGEEIGWRGYLLPKLAASVGRQAWDGTHRAAARSVSHAHHLPHALLHPDGNRWVLVPLFLVALTVGGLLYGYLRLSTNSVWPASLAHSAHNYFWAMFGSLSVAGSPVAAEYLAGESGILPILGYGALVVWLLYRLGSHKPSGLYRRAWQSERAAHSAP